MKRKHGVLMANAIMVIVPYRHAGTWVFDDERVGLVKEPFVLGIPAMIDRLLDQAGLAGVERFRMLFSTSRFPGHQAAIEWVRGEFGGHWYRWTVEHDWIPWAALKSAWRRTKPPLCPNCDKPMILGNFGYPQTGCMSCSRMVFHVCGACHRSFLDVSPEPLPYPLNEKFLAEWLLANLDPDLRPDFSVFHERRTPLPPARGGRPSQSGMGERKR